MKICIVIPTFNESKKIFDLVRQIRELSFLDIVVVDDGSRDNTSALAESAGAKVIRNENNMGKGLSLRQGFKYALESGFEAVITMDGDGQHLPEDISSFLKAAERQDVAIVVGNRMFEVRNMPIIRIITNRFMSALISFVCRQDIPDSQCGFRLIKRSVLERIDFTTKKYEIESEMLIKTAKLQQKIESVPIQTIYENGKSQINPFFDTLRFIRFIIFQYFTK